MLDSLRRYKAGIFQALAHPTRVALVECLESGELSVNTLCERLGLEQANASQHLAVLRNKHIVQTRKVGNQIFYSLRDPAFAKLLEALREYFLSHMSESLEVLRRDQAEAEKQMAAHKKPKAKQEARR